MMKVLKKFFAISICLIGVLAIGCKVNHEVQLIRESGMLESLDCHEMIQTSEGMIHAFVKEQEEAQDTVVFLHGLGMGDTTVTAEPMLSLLGKEHNLFVMNRYGNGCSSDSDKEQTVAFIVETYREALKSANQPEPYVLIAHSISGMYATYWAKQYPQEIKALIYLDADPVECYLEEVQDVGLTAMIGKCEYILTQIGIQRFSIFDDMLFGQTEKQVYTEEQNLLRKYLIYQNTYSKATYSEQMLYRENAACVVKQQEQIQAPQLYLIANHVQGAYYEDIYKAVLQEQYENNIEKIQEKVNDRLQVLEWKMSFVKNKSNMEVVQISGPHCLYEYNPQVVAQVIKDFLIKE